MSFAPWAAALLQPHTCRVTIASSKSEDDKAGSQRRIEASTICLHLQLCIYMQTAPTCSGTHI